MKSDSYQFVVWGKPNNSYQYIQEGFFRALQHQGRKVRWLAQDDGGDYTKTIFISMGNIAHQMPVLSDAFYLIHNFLGNDAVVERRFANSKVLHFGVRTDQSPSPDTYPDQVEDIYWATNLLPYEIDDNKKKAKTLNESSPVINWVGTIWNGYFGNEPELNSFSQSALTQGIRFVHHKDVSLEVNVRLIQESYMAPAIVGSWQRNVGYVPCRIFKNISYGHYGVTNSEAVNRLFGGRLIQESDSSRLFYKATSDLRNRSIDELYELMDYVAKNHTYLNRIDQLLNKAEKLI